MTVHRSRPGALALLVLVLVAAACGAQPGRIQLGVTYEGDATFYAVSSGWLGNCSYPGYGPGGASMYAAMNDADYEAARACGAQILVRRGDRTVSVTVVDRCPECRPGDVDLSPEAFRQLAQPVEGRVRVSWQLVAAPVTGNVQYRVKTGSNQWWLGIQPLNHRWPVQRLEVQKGDAWVTLTRRTYNYFEADGLGAGPFTTRLTDIRGQQLVHPGIALRPDVVQPASSQLT